MTSAPRISVIVATRNRPGLLRRAVASVVRQRYRNVEVCVANDGGVPVDDALSLLDVDINLVNLECRVGVPAARNAALALATGQYAAYLDDDDVYLEDHLERGYGMLATTGADACLSAVWCQHGGELSLDFRYPLDPEFLPVTNAHPPVSLLHRLGAQRQLFDPALTVMEDWDLLQRLYFGDRMSFATNITPTAIYDRTAAAGTSMERRPADVFLTDYRHITAKWAPWITSARVVEYQQRVVDWYDRQIAHDQRGDYEAFLAQLWDGFHATPGVASCLAR
jgi:glycosyltransferase involved in cell wall biosynthesis